MAQVKRLNVVIGAQIQGFQKSLNRVERRLNKFQRSVTRMGTSLTQSITLPLAGIGIASVKMAADVSKSFSKIENLVGITGKSLAEIKDAVAQVSAQTGLSQKELADAAFVVTSAGARGANALEILEKAAQASAIGMGDAGAIARSMTAAITAYGESNLSASKAADILYKTVQLGNLEAESLAPALARVIPVASSMGVSFAEVGANLATFTRLGASADEAATSLSGVLSAILKPSDGAEKALDNLGTSSEELRKKLDDDGLTATMSYLMDLTKGNTSALADIVPNVRALKNVLAVAGKQLNDYRDISEGVKNETGGLASAMANLSKDPAHQFNLALNSLRNAGIGLGKALMPVAIALVNWAQDLIKHFTNLDSETKKQIIQWGLFAGALGPALLVAGQLVTVLKGVATALGFILSPVGLVTAAVVGLGAAAIYIGYNWEAFKDTMNNVWISIKETVFNGVNKVLGWINKLTDLAGIDPIELIDLEEVEEKAEVTWKGISETFGEAWTDMKDLVSEGLGLENISFPTLGGFGSGGGGTGGEKTDGGTSEETVASAGSGGIIDQLQAIPGMIGKVTTELNVMDEAMEASGGVINIWGTQFATQSDLMLAKLEEFREAMAKLTPSTEEVMTDLAITFARLGGHRPAGPYRTQGPVDAA